MTITAASGLRSRMESLDMLANNLANTATAGYKKDAECYGLYMSEAALNGSADADPVSATLPVIDSRWTDYSQGVLQETGNALDLALTGDGFFAVNGVSGTLYTRDGRFRISGKGELETLDGYKVRIDGGGTVKLSSADPLQISAEGWITQKGENLGHLSIVRFADREGLSKAGGSYYESDAKALPAIDATVVQGKVEGSNVNSAESAVRMVQVMRQFEVLTKAVTMSVEMNRKATEEVARVGS